MPLLDIQANNPAATDEPLHRFIRRSVLMELDQKWKPGIRIPPVRQIAARFGVGIATAQLAIRELVNEGILISRPKLGTVLAPGCDAQRIRARITEGSAKTRFGRSKIEGKKIRIRRVPDTDAMVIEMCDVFARAMTKRGCRVDFEEWTDSVADGPSAVETVETDALVLFQPGPRIGAVCSAQQVLLAISTEHALEVSIPSRYDVLSADDEQGSFLAGRHFQTLGCKVACFIGARESKFYERADQFQERTDRFRASSSRRLCGFERGWGALIEPPFQLKVSGHNVEAGAAVVQDYLRLTSRPDAVFASSDELAVGFVQGARAHGLIAGRDYQIIGFDKQQLGMDLPDGPLTTIEVPRAAMGVRGAELLTARLLDPDQPAHRLYLGCSLFEGKTTREVQQRNTVTQSNETR